MYPRKRGPTACHFCRSRRIKCDNVKPACGSCLLNQITCTYSDNPVPLSSVSEPTAGNILERVNYIASLLESHVRAQQTILQPSPYGNGSFLNSPSAIASHRLNLSSTADFNSHEIDHEFLEKVDIPAAAIGCDSVLQWGIFEDVVDRDVGILLFQSNISSGPYSNPRGRESSFEMAVDENQPPKLRGRHSISEDDILPLCDRFLAVVHARNPILDIPDFMRHAKYVSEYGIGWNVDSCLVLLACALASVSDSFQLGNETRDLHSSPLSSASYKDLNAGGDYYFAARKRLGLLETSLEAVQCLMLAGNYEMHILNPIKAWFYFHQACVQLQALLWTKSARYTSLDDASRLERTRRVEQRLYWSCVRFECELRAEIPLPPSGIMSLDFSDPFPSPPSGISKDADHEIVDGPGSFQIHPQRNITKNEQESWFYYLADVAFRKTANRVLTSIYSKEPQSWISNIEHILKQVAEFTEHINLWISHIPAQIRWHDGEVPPNEFAYLLRARAVMCLEWIHRPCLYYAVHQPANDPHMQQVFPLAQRCLQFAMDSAAALQDSYMYRHGGSWSAARSAFRLSLLILAAARSGSIMPPPHWKILVERLIQVLVFWEEEAPDLKQARGIVERIYNDTGG